LKLYLTELAQTEHSIAQGIDGILQARAIPTQKNTANAGTALLLGDTQGFASAQLSVQQSNTLRSASTEDLSRLRLAAYEQAIAYYENYITTFTYAGGRYDEAVPQRRFYLAEAYISLGRYQQAINAFEAYAYEDSPNPMAVEAAYAAILAYEQIPIESFAVNSTEAAFGAVAKANTQPMPTLPETQLSQAQHSQQRFVLNFASDRRAPLIAVKLMQTLFNSSDYADAQRWATWLLIDAPSMHQLNQAQQHSATLVMAHSEFAQGQFAEAEAYYRKLLARPEYANTSNSVRQLAATALIDASGRDDLINRLAASLYKQAEQALASIALTPSELALQSDVYDTPLSETQRAIITRAIQLWQTIISDTPSASFRLAAQYDSASYYALLGQWQPAIATWVDFAKRYPNHALSASIDGQLLFAYQQTQDWEPAAQVLLAQWQQSQQTDSGREALYQAATFFERAERLDLALDSFRKYAHAYPEPLDMANEARFTLSEFYAVSGEDSKRRFWLNALVESQLGLASNGAVSPANAGTPRSRYLAAMSAMVFATDADTVFTRIKLTLPLNQSLAKKQNALSQAINAYDRVMSFGVAEYATQANYHLANLYMTLAQDLIASSRPKELSALELSQYEMLLEEQAYPFEETAIELHENNAARAFNGLYDDFVKQSFRVLKGTLPARYSKQEITSGVSVNEL
jgi:TolA-binding protein